MFKIIWSTSVLLASWVFLAHASGTIPAWIYAIHVTGDHVAYAAMAAVTAYCLADHVRRIKN